MRNNQAVKPSKRLTDREHEIIHRIKVGQTNKAIASDLDIRPSTVSSHVQSIMKKLGCHSRAHAVAVVFCH
jgi:DNA-binding NarL/FixJ family response regulator